VRFLYDIWARCRLTTWRRLHEWLIVKGSVQRAWLCAPYCRRRSASGWLPQWRPPRTRSSRVPTSIWATRATAARSTTRLSAPCLPSGCRTPAFCSSSRRSCFSYFQWPSSSFCTCLSGWRSSGRSMGRGARGRVAGIRQRPAGDTAQRRGPRWLHVTRLPGWRSRAKTS